MTDAQTGVTLYRPALLPGGGVSLTRSLAFAALVQEVMEERLEAHLATLTAVVDAELAAGKPDEAPEPRTYDEMMGKAPAAAPATSVPALTPQATGFEVFEACVNGGWGPRFAAVCVEAVLPSGDVRDVTPEEAAGGRFPAAAFSAALLSFWEAAAPLISGLQNMQSATASRSSGPAAS